MDCESRQKRADPQHACDAHNISSCDLVLLTRTRVCCSRTGTEMHVFIANERKFERNLHMRRSLPSKVDGSTVTTETFRSGLSRNKGSSVHPVSRLYNERSTLIACRCATHRV